LPRIYPYDLVNPQAPTPGEAVKPSSFEPLLTDIAANFVNLPAARIDASITDAQERICGHLGLDRSVLWQFAAEGSGRMLLSHIHDTSQGFLPDAPFDAGKTFPWISGQVLQGNNVIIGRIEDLPPEAAHDRQSLVQWGVKSSFVMPLSVDEKIIGALSFGKLSQATIWSFNITQRLQLISQIFANALSRKQAEARLTALRRFETLVAEISAQFVHLSSDRIDAEIEEAQRRICECLELEFSSLWQWSDKNPESMILTHLHSPPPPYGPVRPDHLEAQVAFPWKLEQLMQGRLIACTTSDLPPEAERDIESYRTYGIKSSVVVPLTTGGGPVIGVLSFEDLKVERSWPEPILNRLRTVAQIFANALARKRWELKLRTQLEEIKDLKQKLEAECIFLRKEVERHHTHKEIVTDNPAMHRILTQVEQVAGTGATVLIEGETGTGKELLARAVHRLSDRRDRPLVTVNCASLPPTLVESELFGREKGAYTGAMTRMTGRFEMADGATLFLDEIGELPLDIQAKLLRVLEQGSFERLGSTKPIRVDVRFIAATNQDLSRQVDAGKFRKDLFFRLNVFPIELPPLRKRPEDIPSLVWHFVRQFEADMGRRIEVIPRRCMDELLRYPWPGNIRELRNVVERALITCNDRTLELRPLHAGVDQSPENLDLEENERRHIQRVLHQTGWRLAGKDGAAEVLGLKRTTLYSKMKKLGIRRPPG
jgi:transcriptional regulator with GAF, ATPase, and Fis domain